MSSRRLRPWPASKAGRAEVPVAERSPGELAPGTQAAWVGRIACMGAAGASVEGRPCLLRYAVNGINLSGSLPEDGEDGEVAVVRLDPWEG